MLQKPIIEECVDEDHPRILSLYPQAFPDEDLVPLVRELFADPDNTFSLVARSGADLIGHIAFSRCSIEGSEVSLSMLAPLGVLPQAQKQGIGSALVEAGFNQLRSAGVSKVFVLGDPAYYSRFGFEAEQHIAPPYPLPKEWAEAWQSIDLAEGVQGIAGTLRVSPPWQHEHLWLP